MRFDASALSKTANNLELGTLVQIHRFCAARKVQVAKTQMIDNPMSLLDVLVIMPQWSHSIAGVEKVFIHGAYGDGKKGLRQISPA